MGALLGLLIILAITGLLYERLAQRRVADQYPPPGQLIAINGRRLHLNCQGTGTPAILLDAGQGGWSSDWRNIMEEVVELGRVCAYDRAGYGWSDPADDERSPQALADDLAALLVAAQVEPPYLLVAFSHAGLPARIFAARHANHMAGMVLVDPATEFDNAILSEELMQQQRATLGIFQGFALAARLGLVRLLDPASMAGSAPFISTRPADPDLYYTFVAHPRWWQSSAREFQSHLTDAHLAQVAEEGVLPNIPLIIIGAGEVESSNTALAHLQTARQAHLRALAAQAPQGEYILAEGATHDILGERPDLIVAAIKRLLEGE